MARLRHFAVCVKDLEKAAKFYETVFELKRSRAARTIEIGSAIYMSDGVINLALLNFAGGAGSKASDSRTRAASSARTISASRSTTSPRRRSASRRRAASSSSTSATSAHGNFERKFKDPDGVIFDISKHGWQGTDGTDGGEKVGAPSVPLESAPNSKTARLFDELIGIEVLDRRLLLDDALGEIEVLQLGQALDIDLAEHRSAPDRPSLA